MPRAAWICSGLLDAERARLDADLAWARGMADYWQSVARLEAAEGVGQ